MGFLGRFAPQQSRTAYVADGSFASILRCPRDFRFTPNIYREADIPAWLKSANSGIDRIAPDELRTCPDELADVF